VWHSIPNPSLELIRLLNQLVVEAQDRNPQLLPDLTRSDNILIASDYSGQHQTARFESSSFLFTTRESWVAWAGYRKQLRDQFLRDGRRMSFKRLSDSQRWEALPHFLAAAGGLHGLSLTVLIDRSIRSLFQDGWVDPATFQLPQVRTWKPEPLERLLRVTTFSAFLTAGLSREGQSVIWFTDQDEIAANSERLDELTRLFDATLMRFLSHDLGAVQCATTDGVDLQIEDFVAIPDLIAGALAELLSEYQRSGVSLGAAIAPPPAAFSPKGRLLMDWLSDPRPPLRRLVLSIEPTSTAGEIAVKQIVFHSAIGTE
jgi:hypothetical protein